MKLPPNWLEGHWLQNGYYSANHRQKSGMKKGPPELPAAPWFLPGEPDGSGQAY
jgi:hypothetical protein